MTQRDRLLDHIHRLALHGMGERRTDGQLLELFISARDEAAFALLLRRHGAMVWSVCRRVLGNAHDADDAFQATFLVLVRKADSIRPREAVGNWLYGVAYRTALEARGRIARRRSKEQPLQDVPQPEIEPQEPWQELRPILDRELSRLADKYRLPIVLCDLEGRSRKEVARQLAIPEGTLSSRLAMGRKKLAARLARYGFAITVASLGTLLTEKTATASVSLSLLSATTKAALLIAAGPAVAAGVVSATVSTLTEGVLKAMFIAKIKTATLVLCSVAALGAGTGGVYYQTRVGAADSSQVDRAVQDNRRSTSTSRTSESDRLKSENEQLRNMLKIERDRMADIREKFNTLVEKHLKTLQVAAQSDQPKQKPKISDSDRLKSENEQLRDMLKRAQNRTEGWREKFGTFVKDNAKTILEAEAAAHADDPDQVQSDEPDKPSADRALEKREAERDQLKKKYQSQSDAMIAQLEQLTLQQKKLEAERRQLESQLRSLATQRQELERTQRKMKEGLQREVEKQKQAYRKDKIKREQGANPSKTKPVEKPASGDKLDQILQRLERLEKRLDRLERDRKP